MSEKKTERMIVVLSPSELEELDNWRFKNHIASRSEAVRQLIKNGINQPPPSQPQLMEP